MRTLSKELKINPNTAHKVVGSLINEGLLESRPGIGTVVAERPRLHPARNACSSWVTKWESLVVEAKRLGIDLDAMLASFTAHWQRLTASSPNNTASRNNSGEGARKKI